MRALCEGHEGTSKW
jgi:hypothetical protein